VITNTCLQNYKFMGKERDIETGNDDFGARYYSSRFGRWLSPDWSAVPAPVPYANLTNPQTLNLYAMARDNPETFADLDGHNPVADPPAGEQCPPGGCPANQTATPAVANDTTPGQNTPPPPATPKPPPMAELKTDMKGHTTTLYTTDKNGKLTTTQIETSNAVDHRAKPGAAGPYTTHNIVGVSNRHAGDKAYGPAGAFIDTGDARGRDIHGGGSSLGVHAFDPQQPLTPTFGCTRGHNQDVIDLGTAITNFQQANPGVVIPYVRE
jgi:RHS repeat-associated protein